MKKGFTLVELSIVLVIIGLLIGGILVAQSMIETAKVQNIIRTIQQYDIAVNNFKTKYNSLPGDSRLLSGGNGDGIYQDSTGQASYTNFSGEIANFWSDLQKGGFNYQDKVFTPVVPSAGFNNDVNAPNSPKISMNAEADIIVNSGGYPAVPQYSFANLNGINPTGASTYSAFTFPFSTAKPVLYPANALAIDLKMDDGNPISGRVSNKIMDVPGLWFTGGVNVSSCDNGTGNSATAVYAPQNKTVFCYLQVQMQI